VDTAEPGCAGASGYTGFAGMAAAAVAADNEERLNDSLDFPPLRQHHGEEHSSMSWHRRCHRPDNTGPGMVGTGGDGRTS